MTVAAVLLAAGGGRRFRAGPKLLAPMGDGRPVLVHALDAVLAAGLDAVVVVQGAVDLAAVVPAGVALVSNPGWEAGLASSLAVGIDAARAAGHTAVVVGLGDQPGITAAAWASVGRADTHPIEVATYRGARRNPVRLAAEVWELLPRVGDEGARGLMRLRPELVGEIPCAGDPGDIDTEEDLAAWS